MNVEALAGVLHKVIDLLGGGAGHLHAEVDEALGTAPAAAPPPAPTDEEVAAAKAVLARAAPAADAAPAATA